MQVIVDHGLGDKAENDFRLVRDCCPALLKMTPTKLKPDDPDCPLKFGLDHDVFVRLEKLLVEGVGERHFIVTGVLKKTRHSWETPLIK